MTKSLIFWPILGITVLFSDVFRQISIGMASGMGFHDYSGVNTIMGALALMVIYSYKKDREDG